VRSEQIAQGWHHQDVSHLCSAWAGAELWYIYYHCLPLPAAVDSELQKLRKFKVDFSLERA